MTHTTDTIAYFNVVSRETVHITLALVELHDLEVKTAGVFNSHVTALNHEKI